MPSPAQRLGNAAEELAAKWLHAKGYRILDRHYTCRYGEIDIVAEKNRILVFVEVRARRPSKFGDVLQSMSQQKQHRLAAAIEEYRNHHPEYEALEYQCDLLSVDPEQEAITHYPELALHAEV